MKPKLLTLILLWAILFLLILSAIALAQGGDPLTLFTDNVTSTGPTTDVTVMEQELLDRLNAATTWTYHAPIHAVALACPGVDYIRLWPLPVKQPSWDPTDEPWPGWHVWR